MKVGALIEIPAKDFRKAKIAIQNAIAGGSK
jgi:hypothetical protein